MSAPAVGGLASVIVPCWNQLEFTRKCVSALMRQTGPSWELIVIDNGSTDGTGSYLAGVQDASPVAVTVIGNATNRGFPAAINQGLQYARGEYLVLLNNDVVVTEGWLGQLIGLASVVVTTESVGKTNLRVFTTEITESTELDGRDNVQIGLVANLGESGGTGIASGGIGLVGPMSNYAAPPQLVEDVGLSGLG